MNNSPSSKGGITIKEIILQFEVFPFGKPEGGRLHVLYGILLSNFCLLTDKVNPVAAQQCLPLHRVSLVPLCTRRPSVLSDPRFFI